MLKPKDIRRMRDEVSEWIEHPPALRLAATVVRKGVVDDDGTVLVPVGDAAAAEAYLTVLLRQMGGARRKVGWTDQKAEGEPTDLAITNYCRDINIGIYYAGRIPSL